MKSALIYIILALATGVAVGLIISDNSEIAEVDPFVIIPGTTTETSNNAVKSSDTARIAPQLIELNKLLQKEIRARQALEQKFEKLSRQMTELAIGSKSVDENGESEQPAVSEQSSGPGLEKSWFDEQALIDNGMNISQASELKHYFEQLELEGLYLRDQSIREGWDREKLNEAMQALSLKEDEIKNQLSESDYDAYLYASGQTNRVEVTSVLASAEAGTAGILSGDHIIRYDNQRIYDGFELRLATTGGSIEEMVELEVERDGERLKFYLPRGPLGIRMSSVSVAP